MKRTTKLSSPPALTLISKDPLNHKGRRSKTSDMSKECAEELRYLLKEAECGYITGVAFVYITNAGSFNTGSVGDSFSSPTFTLGMLEILKTKLVQKVLDKAAGR